MKTKLAQQKVAMWLAGAAFLWLSGCGGDTTPTPTPTKQQLYLSCGDPACRGYTAKAGVPLCTTEKVGDSCTTAGTKCDPMDGCNAVYTCAASDPCGYVLDGTTSVPKPAYSSLRILSLCACVNCFFRIT